MIETISPVVHGGRNRRYYLAVMLHVVGATLSAALLGLLLGGLGRVLGAPWGSGGLWALVAVAGLYAVREMGDLKIPLPDLDRQVPDWWRTFYSHNVAAFLYGLGLGIGFVTYLSFGTLVAVAAGALVAGDPAVGAALMGAFGLARGLSVLIVARTQPTAALDVLEAGPVRRRAALMNGATLSLVALLALLEI